jgi:UDP-N-acetylmuramoyl-L-alanyl-D-glutamate--2,6-diaminopimelate ligase
VDERHRARLRELYGSVRTVAVTGTNGKTTTTSMIAAIVEASGEPWARATTLGMSVAGEALEDDGSMRAFADMIERSVAASVRTVALETTSRSLASGFARRWPPDVAVFTNLTRDHLDRHGSPEAYLAAKAQLFLALPVDGTAVLNADDGACALLDEVLPRAVRRRWYGVSGARSRSHPRALDARAERVVATRDGTTVELAGSALAEALGRRFELRAVGAVHAYNALGAALAAEAAGYDGAAIRRGLEQFPGVRGRFEVIAREPLVIVDYAHTPDALERSIVAARELVTRDRGTVTCVFGCGGDRDTGKRPEMGRIADDGADRVIVTNDNPRSEAPSAIAQAIEAGARGRSELRIVLDRREAICLAVAEAGPADAVLIAGKGHETSQEVGGIRVPFDDAAVARDALAARG